MQISITKEFTSVECCGCGAIFWVTNGFNENRLKDKRLFYCPNGHSQAYIKSTAEKLQEKLDQAYKDNGDLRVKEIEARMRADRAERQLKKCEKPKKKS